MVSHHLTKFGSHRHSSSRDIIVLVCYAIFQNHVIKKSYDFMVGANQVELPSCQVWWS